MNGFPRILLDSGAVIHAERHPRGKVFIECQEAADKGLAPLLPSVVLAQVWRDPRKQHSVVKVGGICETLSFTARTARRVGRLLKESGTNDIVDAAVVIEAIDHGAAIVTSDPGDIKALVNASGFEIAILTV